MVRAFVAIELSEELRATLATIQQGLRQQLERMVARHVRISWVRPGSMHLTLKFLGDTADESIDPLRAAIEEGMSARHVITIPLERLGTFPRPQAPRVLWVGPSGEWEQGREAQRLTDLHRAIEACCRAANFAPEERPFSPHLTLARIKEGAREVGEALAQSGMLERPVILGTLPVGAIALMKSDLHPTGSVYTKLWECPLVSSAT